MLNAYIAATQNLLQNPTAPTSLYPTTALITYINTARSQLAAESECIRLYTTGTTSTSIPYLPFSSVTVPSSFGINNVLNVRMISSGTNLLNSHAWEWFNLYYFNADPALPQGVPTDWTQYGQGVYGTVFFSPTPNTTITLNFDCIALPINLTSDSDPEAIPYPWTDAVPFFAAFYALLSAQSPARNTDADKMFARYQLFKDRARQFSNPSVETYQYPQSGPPPRNLPFDPTMQAAKAGQ